MTSAYVSRSPKEERIRFAARICVPGEWLQRLADRGPARGGGSIRRGVPLKSHHTSYTLTRGTKVVLASVAYLCPDPTEEQRRQPTG